MTVKHIVLFQFKAGTEPPAVQDACARMLSLKDSCLHPESQKPYITSSSGGRDNSPENMQDGIEFAFIVEFDNLADRDYYAKHDPNHQAFVKSIRPIIEKAIVVDYIAGTF